MSGHALPEADRSPDPQSQSLAFINALRFCALSASEGQHGVFLPESENLADLYGNLLKKYIERNSIYRQTRERADRALLPQELFEMDELLAEFERTTAHSQNSLNQMIAENEPAQQVLQRNISALAGCGKMIVSQSIM